MKNIKNVGFENVPVLDWDNIECEFGIPVTEYAFYQSADHFDGYLWLNTDEDAVEFLEQEIKEWEEYGEEWTENRNYFVNELELINALRSIGLDDGVIVYVWEN